MNKKLIASAVALLIGSTLHSIEIEESRVLNGEFEFVENGNQGDCVFMISDDGIIECNFFALARGETLSIEQKSNESWGLLRINSKEPVHISGKIKANGNFLICCPAGLKIDGEVIGSGVIASSHMITDKSFLSDQVWKFTNKGGAVQISGTLTASEGDLYVFGEKVETTGDLNGEELWLATGNEVVVGIDNEETIALGFVHNSGTIHANHLRINSKEIVNTGAVFAEGSKGSVELNAKEGLLLNEGKILARQGNCGGTVSLSGKEVTFTNSAIVNVCGEVGGGNVKIVSDHCYLSSAVHSYDTLVSGGDVIYSGRDLTEEEMREVIKKNGAFASLIQADALVEGNGGSISIHSNQDQYFGAQILARGAGDEGRGGRLGLCSKGNMTYRGAIDLHAPSGKPGEFFLDPKYVTISPLGTDSATGNTFASDSTGSVTISGSDLQAALNSASVVIQANTDITFGDTVLVTTSGTNLSLQAGRSIIFSGTGDLELNNGNFTALINDPNAIGADRESGEAFFQMNGNSRIFCPGGDINVSAGNQSGTTVGKILLGDCILGSTAGNVNLTGIGYPGTSGSNGIRLSNGTISTTGNGTITLTGTGGAGVDNNMGVYLTGKNAQILGDTGLITIDGTGGASSGKSNQGVRIESGAKVISTTGNIDCTGNAGSGTDWNMGVILTGTNSRLTSTSGDISVTGTAGGSGSTCQGVRLEIGSYIDSNGAVVIDGTGATGLANCHGVCISGNGSLITSATGSISVTGVGNGDGTAISEMGVRLESAGKITSTGSATINVNGTGGAGTDYNNGIILSGGGSNISSSGGDITLVGIANGTGSQNQGIRCESKGSVLATGAANIMATGTGADAVSLNNGVLLIGVGSLIDAVDGDVTVIGTAQGEKPAEGVSEQGGVIASQNGTVSITSNDVI